MKENTVTSAKRKGAMNLKAIFRPICWITELYYYIKYGSLISGHSFIEQDDLGLECEICGMVSK
jgi:hypothetical protein